MKKIISLLSVVLFFIGCSTNNNGTVTVIPIAPSNLTGTVISTTQINLSWTDNATNEDGYKIERKTGGGNFTVVGSAGANISNFSDLGLTANTAYTYRVYAYNSAGNSLQYSNELTLTTQDSIPSWLTNGLVGYWPLNGNANDESGNGNNGIVNGATLTTDRFGNNWKAYNFDGLNNVINIPTNQTLVIQNNITISAWIKRKNPSNLLPEGIFGPATYLPTTPGYYLRIINKKVDLGISLPYTEGFSATTIDSSHWYNVVGVYNNNSIKIYISGVMDNETFAGPDLLDNWSSTNFLTIGREKDYGTPINLHSFDGSLDDIRIYNRALSASEVLYLAAH
jgi:hypothetical protein